MVCLSFCNLMRSQIPVTPCKAPELTVFIDCKLYNM